MVVNSLYYNSPQPFKAEKTSISISDEVLTAALQAIYARDFNPQSTIEPTLFTAISATLRSAISAPVPGDSSPGLDPILSALRHSADVFAAFKVHRAQNDMAARLLDSNGNLKPFEQWKAEVLPIASHQCGPWLETEYNTAVLRARQTAQWQQFLAEKDVLPNLKWLPSTSPNPGADHRLYWNTVLPIGHPFWDKHRPGDRWNCKCSLTSTDEPPTPVPSEEEPPFPTVSQSGNTPHPGLAGNPAKTRAIFSQDHPYFPKDCNHCAFYKPNVKSRLRSIFKAKAKDCYNCPFINGCIDRSSEMKRKIKEIKAEARKAVQGKILSNPKFSEEILVSRASIDEWTNQPFMYMTEKHQMLLDIERVLREAKYLGPVNNHKERKGVKQSHIFQTHVVDIDAYIIVLEYSTGEFILHSISDSPNIINFLKRKIANEGN